MNWIRDNIVKIIVVLVIAVLVIVFAVACSGGDDNEVGTESATGYVELENKLQNAAYKYVKKNQKLLPKTIDKIVKIKLDTLISNRYIKEIHAIENSSIVCSGYVEITKKYSDKSDYRYTPYLKCGKYYETKVIGDYIKTNENVVTDGDGLYLLSNVDGSSYYYKGEDPNNYIVLDEKLFRILEIDENNYLKLIAMDKTYYRYAWDDRYNSSVGRDNNYGINDYSLSRIKDTLEFLYSNTIDADGEIYFSDKIKGYIVEKEFCIGKRSSSDKAINKEKECKETNLQKVGLITVSDYYRVSTSTGCTEVGKLDCNNYNYLYSYRNNKFVTLTPSADNTYSYYFINDGDYDEAKCNKVNYLYPVIYINNNIIYKSGDGSKADPYVVR